MKVIRRQSKRLVKTLLARSTSEENNLIEVERNNDDSIEHVENINQHTNMFDEKGRQQM